MTLRGLAFKTDFVQSCRDSPQLSQASCDQARSCYGVTYDDSSRHTACEAAIKLEPSFAWWCCEMMGSPDTSEPFSSILRPDKVFGGGYGSKPLDRRARPQLGGEQTTQYIHLS